VKPTLRIKIVSGFVVVALAAVAVGLVGQHLVTATHDTDERSDRQSLGRVVAVSDAQVAVLMGEVFGSGLLIYGRNDSLMSQMVGASTKATNAIVALGHQKLSPAARALHAKLVRYHSSLVKLENNLFGLSLPVPDPSVPALQLENMGQMQAVQNTIAATAEGLRQQITKDATAARDATTADANHQIQTLLWVVVAVGLGIVAFGVWLSGRLVRRVRTTAAILGRVAEGDLTPRFEGGGHDEVGQMANALNTTLGTVHDVMCQIESDAVELSTVAEQASEQSATASAAVNQISGYVRSIRSTTAEMAAQANQLAGRMHDGPLADAERAELAHEIEQFARQARMVADGLGDQGLGRAAHASSVIAARSQATADRLAEMAGNLDAIIGMFVIERAEVEPAREAAGHTA